MHWEDRINKQTSTILQQFIKFSAKQIKHRYTIEKATSYIKLGSYKLSMNKCTVINREIFAILLALIYAKAGEKKKSYEKKLLTS